MRRYSGYMFLGAIAVPLSRAIPGVAGTVLIALLPAFLMKACYHLYRRHRALQLDTQALRDKRPLDALLAWEAERREFPIDRRYELGWFSGIAIFSIAMAMLPPQIAGKLLGYTVLAELLVLAFFLVRLRLDRIALRRTVATLA